MHDVPPYTTVLNFYYKAVRERLQNKILKMLVQKPRETSENPTYAIINSQSVKTVYNSEKRGFDEEKNERTKVAHSNKYYGKSPRCSCYCTYFFFKKHLSSRKNLITRDFLISKSS